MHQICIKEKILVEVHTDHSNVTKAAKEITDALEWEACGAAAAPLLAAGAIALLTVAVNFVVDWMLHKSSGLKE